MDKTQVEIVEKITSILVHLTVIVGALIAVIKLKLYRVLDHRFHAEFRASHTVADESRILFEGDYVIHNTGDRPIRISEVEIRIYSAKEMDGLVVVDKDKELAARVVNAATASGQMEINAGEKATFAMRCMLPAPEGCVFALCQFKWPYKRTPGSYLSIYVYKRGSTFTVRERGT